ncbi:hypothetical protein ACFX1Z_027463 [Malus domestica]
MVLAREPGFGRQAVVDGDDDGGNFGGDLRAVSVRGGVGGGEEYPGAVVEVDDEGEAGHGVVVGGKLGGSEDPDPGFGFRVECHVFRDDRVAWGGVRVGGYSGGGGAGEGVGGGVVYYVEVGVGVEL